MAKYENEHQRRESREDYEDRRRAVQRQHYEEQQRMMALDRAHRAQMQQEQAGFQQQPYPQQQAGFQQQPYPQQAGERPQQPYSRRQTGAGPQPSYAQQQTGERPQQQYAQQQTGAGPQQPYAGQQVYTVSNGPQGTVQRRINGGSVPPVPPVRYPGEGSYPGEGKPSQEPPKKKGKAGGIITTIILIAAIAVFVFAAYKLLGYYLDYKAGSDEYNRLKQDYVSIQPAAGSGQSENASGGVIETLTDVEELEDPATKQAKVDAAKKEAVVENGTQKELPSLINPINFTDLNAINEDIIGWIRLGALDISYPIAQAADNDYYLHRTFERADNFAGCIFLNCDNSKYFSDQNSIVYGHNMKDGSMFGKLKDLKVQETYDSNPYFWIFTPQFIYQYRIFSCSIVSSLGDPYRIRFTTEEFQSFINIMIEGSVVDNHGLEVTPNDRLVTLSTCTGNDATRFIVQGKLEQIYIAK